MRGFVFNLLRIPPEPEPPAGSHSSVRVFRAARNFYRFLVAKWLLKQLGVVVGAVSALIFLGQWTRQLPEYVAFWINMAEWIGLAGVVLQMPFTFYLVKFDYELRWYIITDRSLRIRSGVWDIREMTMTFANIQNTSVQQGPLQRLLGISDVMVRTAGGGSATEAQGQHRGAGEMMHIGYFHGVENAGEIRDLLKERLRRYRDTGLGDPDEAVDSGGSVPEPVGNNQELLDAARAFAGESRRLRQQLAASTN